MTARSKEFDICFVTEGLNMDDVAVSVGLPLLRLGYGNTVTGARMRSNLRTLGSSPMRRSTCLSTGHALRLG
jgi:hypothetical protein